MREKWDMTKLLLQCAHCLGPALPFRTTLCSQVPELLSYVDFDFFTCLLVAHEYHSNILHAVPMSCRN